MMTRQLAPGVTEGYLQVQPKVAWDGDVATIECGSVYYKQVNEAVRASVEAGAKVLRLLGVNGQRYIGTGLHAPEVRIEVNGTAGNDLAMFLDGPTIDVIGNAQDGVGNTMNAGQVNIHGDAGDVLGYGMRGGRVFVKGDVGYRVGIHMKAYESLVPVMVCGGKARDFFGEYMAGGLLVLLGMNTRDAAQPLVGGFTGSGMHGGAIYLRGEVERWQCGAEVGVFEADEADLTTVRPHVEEFAETFGMDAAEILGAPFTKLVPVSHRPYGNLYAY